jgi:hypothetical protein
MASDPFFDPLVANVQSDGESPHDDNQAQHDGDVDDWFERAASGSRGGGDGDVLPPTEQLGAAALPLEGDLVRPGRRPHTRHLSRTTSVRPDEPFRQAASRPPPRRLRPLAFLALATGVLVLVVVLVMRPASPGPPSAAPKPTARSTPSAMPPSARSATQQAADHARSDRAARALTRRRAAAAHRHRQLAAQRRRRAAAQRRAARAQSTPTPRRRPPAAVAPTPATPRRPIAPPPPAPPRRPSVSPICVEFPPC